MTEYTKNLIAEYRPRMTKEIVHSWAQDAVEELIRLDRNPFCTKPEQE